MRNYLTSRNLAVVVPSALLLGLFVIGSARAVTDNVFRYSSPKTGFYTIPSAALVPSNGDDAGNYSNSATNSGLTTSAGSPCFLAGVNLPNGVTITAMRVWYASGADGDPIVRLWAQVLGQGAAVLIAITNINDDSQSQRATNATVSQEKVNNGRNAYALEVCIFPNDFFFAARITYTYETAGD